MNSPPTLLPVTCSRCGGAFLAPSDDERAIIECPHCRRQAARSAWAAATPPVPAPAPARRLGSAGAIIGLAVGGAAILAGANWLFFRMRPTVAQADAARRGATEAPAKASAVAAMDEAPLELAYAVARRALSSDDWTAARPFLRQSDGLEALMKRFHAVHPWTPVAVASRRDGRLVDRDGGRWAEISIATESGRIIELSLENTPQGWKLDWEALVNAPRFEWDEFYREMPVDSRHLRLSALRGSVPDGYYSAAGTSAEESLAVRLFGPDPGDSMIALVPRASDVGRLFQRSLTWEVPRRYVCEIRCADPNALPARVEITAFVKEGWAEGP